MFYFYLNITYNYGMSIQDIREEIQFIEDYETQDIKVLLAYIIQKLEILEEEVEELKEIM